MSYCWESTSDLVILCLAKVQSIAHFASSTVRRGIRHKHWEKDDGKGGHKLTGTEGLGVEGVAPHDEAARPLEGEGVTGGN
jgi:hypothetical protein